MARASRNPFTTVSTEGGLLPPDFLQRLVEGEKGIDGLTPESYHLIGGEKPNEAASRSWNRLQAAWTAFQTASGGLKAEDAGTGLTRERWLLPLFNELGYGRLQTAKTFEIDGKAYPISHLWQLTPIHLVGRNVELDRRSPGVIGAAKTTPHGLMQEFLNRDEGYLWGFVSNGLKLRILRDNKSLTRQAYVEFDLAGMMDGQVYSDFAVLFLLCHQSRVEAERAQQCWLEKWADAAREQGTRALDQLRAGVEGSIKALGRGFLAQPGDRHLVDWLRSGALDKQDYYRQLLRTVYRLIFLFVAEDRDLLLTAAHGSRERKRYLDHYSASRLRALAERRRGTPHPDLWQALRLVFAKLSSDTGCPELGLPALGSFLWSDKATPDLDRCELANADLLEAIRSLAFTLDGKIRRAIDYRNLGAEELGSVYESLLELHPDVNADAPTFDLKVAAGHERKATGSYYTPTSLIESLLDSALEPVLREAAKQPDAERAILDLKVCDPACGSGHFLIAAAHRMANRLAAVRTGDEEPSPEAVRKALRDIVGRCLYGVDINPMAVELCKVNLWLEALEPGKPLSFLEHHIQCGNSLLGATPALLKKGIPDEAFEPLEGDDKTICRIFKKNNKAEREGGQTSLLEAMHEPWGFDLATAVSSLDTIADDTPKGQRAKQLSWEVLIRSDDYEAGRLLADAWCAALVWRKARDPKLPYPITDAVFRQIERDPLSTPDWMRKQIRRLAEEYQFLHWYLTFPAVFRTRGSQESPSDAGLERSGGFDCILSNPPWIAYVGRQQAKISDQGLRLLLARFACVARWPASHPAFMVLSVQSLSERGRAGLVLPKQVAELGAYAAARERVTAVAQLASPVVDVGEDAFVGVTQPVGLFLLSARREEATGSSAPWSLAALPHGREGPDATGAATVSAPTALQQVAAQLAGRPRFEPKTFADPGVHTGNVSKKLILAALPPNAEGYESIREGRDIAAFVCAPPRKWLWAKPTLGEAEYCTIREAKRYTGVPILVRQTADRPIAARHVCPTYFRNSLLACAGVPGVPDAVLLAFLNSALYALLHRAHTQDANQKAFPQVKVRHLHSLPAIPVEALKRRYDSRPLRDALEASVLEAEAAAQLDHPPPSQILERIERMVLTALDLPPDLAPHLREVAK